MSNSLLRGHTLQAALSLLGEKGPAGLDFYAASPHLTISAHEPTDTLPLARALSNHGLSIRCFTLAPYRYDLCYAPDSPAGQASLTYFARAVEAARKLSAGLVVLPAGQGEADRDIHQRRAHVMESLAHLTALGQGMPLAVEVPFAPPRGKTLWQTDFLQQVANTLPSLSFAFNTRMLLLSPEGWAQWLHAAAGRIALIRLADGHWHGEKPWGEGVVFHPALKDILQEAGPACILSARLQAEMDAQTAEHWHAIHSNALSAALRDAA